MTDWANVSLTGGELWSTAVKITHDAVRSMTATSGSAPRTGRRTGRSCARNQRPGR
jgi:hypothetical protein